MKIHFDFELIDKKKSECKIYPHSQLKIVLRYGITEILLPNDMEDMDDMYTVH